MTLVTGVWFIFALYNSHQNLPRQTSSCLFIITSSSVVVANPNKHNRKSGIYVKYTKNITMVIFKLNMVSSTGLAPAYLITTSWVAVTNPRKHCKSDIWLRARVQSLITPLFRIPLCLSQDNPMARYTTGGTKGSSTLNEDTKLNVTVL